MYTNYHGMKGTIMKISDTAISDLAMQMIYHAIDGGISKVKPDPEEIEKAYLALHFKKALANGNKRITIDIVRPKTRA